MPDVRQCDDIAPGVTFRCGRGSAAPTYPLRFRVADIEGERAPIVREDRPPVATPLERFEGLVALCDFVDPWGNAFGLYQVLFAGGTPPTLSGTNRYT